MPRPCYRDHDHSPDTCHLCRLVATSKFYRDIMGEGQGVAMATPARCVHLGEETGELVTCSWCGGRTKLKVFACAVHGKCTIGPQEARDTACCTECPDRVEQVTPTPFCECKEDGFCPRYGRLMGGRTREICAGINVDLGTAAAFREQWMRETNKGMDRQSLDSKSPPKSLLLKTDQAPGDAVAMTAAIYSLHQAHPGKYLTAVESYWPDVFAYNPDVPVHLFPSAATAGGVLPGLIPIQMHYPAIHQSNQRGIHFMQAWCEFLGSALGISVPLLTNRPRLYFDAKSPSYPTEDFWLICSGGKRDFTNKLWGHSNYQQVVSSLRGRVRFIQVGGSRPVVPWRTNVLKSQEDSHPLLDGVEDMVGKTTLRELFDITQCARGVLCGVSLLMHIAAALEKPAVVIAGGREPVAWNAYPKQQYVHTVGALPCASSQGEVGGACWRGRVVPLGDGTTLDRDTCERPVDGLPQCMRMITPEEVVNLILRYT